MKRYLIVILAALLLLCGTVCAAAEDSEAPAPQVMTTVDQSTPRLMVTGYLLADSFVEPGRTTALTITFKNTSNTKSIRNIKFTLTDPAGELMPDGMGTLYLPFLAAGSTYQWNTALSAVYTAAEGRHAMEVSAEYEDAQFMSYSANDTIYVNVRQQVSLTYDNAALPKIAVQGDTITLSINVMNTGKTALSNVTVRCKVRGLAAGGSTFLGEIAPGESTVAAPNLRVSEEQFGEVKGKIVFTYEDGYGKQYKKTETVSTVIEAPAPQEQPQQDEKKKTDLLPWWAWLTVGIVGGGAVGCAVPVAAFGAKRRKEDEKRL